MVAGKLCAAIVSKDSNTMIRSARQALDEGADLVEFRLDHLLRIEKDLPDRLRGFSGRCVITIRSKEQGGAFAGSEGSRIEMLKAFSKIKPLYLDIELHAARKNPEAVAELKKNCRNLIVSFHDFDATPRINALVQVYNEAIEMAGIVKVVTMARSAQDNITSMLLYRKARPRGSLIAFTMGDIGTLTRVLCLYAGSPMSYVSFGNKPSAPGQIPLKTMRRLI